MMTRTTYSTLAAVGLIAAMSANAQPGGFPAPVRVDEARMESMSATILVPGTVVSRHDARVSAEVEGVLVEVAEVGAVVEARGPVARIRNTILELRHPELQAQVARERARLEFFDGEVARLEKLAQQNNAARTQLDQTRSDREVAFNDMNVAIARLAQVEDQLERTSQKAPFAGIVVERFLRPGERVNLGSPIVRMVDPDSLEVIARAPLEYLPYLTRGDRLGLTVAGRDAEATVRTLAAVGDENTHVFELRADIPGGSQPVGMTVRLALPASETRQVLSVPRDALVLRPDSISVFVVDPDNTARKVEVTTGLASGDRIEVLGDLNSGERVVIRGNERLRPGQQVSVQGDTSSASEGQVAGQ